MNIYTSVTFLLALVVTAESFHYKKKFKQGEDYGEVDGAVRDDRRDFRRSCTTVMDDVWEEKCKTLYNEKCDTKYEKRCASDKCKTFNVPYCDVKMVDSCSTEEECNPSTQRECVKIPKKTCSQVPDEEIIVDQVPLSPVIIETEVIIPEVPTFEDGEEVEYTDEYVTPKPHTEHDIINDDSVADTRFTKTLCQSYCESYEIGSKHYKKSKDYDSDSLLSIPTLKLKTVCRESEEESCYDRTRQVCNNVQKCTKLPKKSCGFNATKKCAKLPTQKCSDIPKEVCKDVPRSVCRDVPREVCLPYPEKSCKKIIVKRPREECRPVEGY
ncbi:unnamed protein product [Lepeophtheirus salmonis]|uniref:(salmon louse) hypothetical protein n=1 Tax=Lepeophtheirus salmonis TaxID=72036 RepID=A0A7R8H0V4_LEPSM|nr:unnamed protein product [Lepeophtheirus salmonis]CAF2798162.1 unnamed protein product [Lepeophtheirus salmonis]